MCQPTKGHIRPNSAIRNKNHQICSSDTCLTDLRQDFVFFHTVTTEHNGSKSQSSYQY
ncbi:hypothetical protein C1H46_045846 [Malus baccata]|uniref:Uncharacterized protein n=1 Tax=Malus baccata TaxID=106549 RepID=A0A540K2Y4_MALBA|nr:hypothetical protein C1H46_045846 [Malus baccata]